MCPECQTLTSPVVPTLLNGLVAFLKYGLGHSFGGFGFSQGLLQEPVLGEDNLSNGVANYRPSKNLDGAGVIDELATLLTSGRLSREKREMVKSVYEEYEGIEALINVEQVIVTTPEFHANALARNGENARPQVEPPEPSSKPYKAVIQIMLDGGMDSYNVVVPSEGDCTGKNAAGEPIDQQYRDVRGSLALQRHMTDLRISADGQPCSKFAIHSKFPILKELYDEGSLAIIANTGVLNTHDTNKQNFYEKTVSRLFAHDHMKRETEKMDPFDKKLGTGVMGRMSLALEKKGYRTSGISIDLQSWALNTNSATITPFTVSRSGFTVFNDRPSAEEHFDLEGYAAIMNNVTDTYTNLFGETWSSEYTASVSQAEFYSRLLDETDVIDDFKNVEQKFGSRLSMLSRLIQTRNGRGVDRDFYFMKTGSFDHHSNMLSYMDYQLEELNTGLAALVKDLKERGVWDDVTILITSDFGRTLSPNGSDGTDHAWGGHYMIMGGSVKGGQFLGQYPDDITESGPVNIGRGRLMPTTSWDAIFSGIADWMGVDDKESMLEVLPNLDEVVGNGFTDAYTKNDMYRENRRMLRSKA